MTDLEAIKQLHADDIAAIRRRDGETLLSLWTDDGVAIPPDEKPIAGKAALGRMIAAGMEQLEEVDIIDYTFDFKEIEISGNTALEWGTYYDKYVDKESDEILESSGNIMRYLRKGDDGKWRVARAIWTISE